MSKTLKALLFAAILAVAALSALLPVAAEKASAEPSAIVSALPASSAVVTSEQPPANSKDPWIEWSVSEERLDVGDEVEITVSIMGLDDPAVKPILGMQVSIGYDQSRMEWQKVKGSEMLLAHTENEDDFIEVGHNAKSGEIIFLYANLNMEEVYFPRDNTVLFKFRCKMISKVGPGDLEFPITVFNISYSDKTQYLPEISDSPKLIVIDPVSPTPDNIPDVETNPLGWVILVVGLIIVAGAAAFIVLRNKKANPDGEPKPVKEKPEYTDYDDDDDDDDDDEDLD